MNNDYYFISELRKALLAQGLTQKEIARKGGLSQSVVCKLLKGHTPNLRFRTVVLLWPIAFGAPFPNIDPKQEATPPAGKPSRKPWRSRRRGRFAKGYVPVTGTAGGG